MNRLESNRVLGFDLLVPQEAEELISLLRQAPVIHKSPRFGYGELHVRGHKKAVTLNHIAKKVLAFEDYAVKSGKLTPEDREMGRRLITVLRDKINEVFRKTSKRTREKTPLRRIEEDGTVFSRVRADQAAGHCTADMKLADGTYYVPLQAPTPYKIIEDGRVFVRFLGDQVELERYGCKIKLKDEIPYVLPEELLRCAVAKFHISTPPLMPSPVRSDSIPLTSTPVPSASPLTSPRPVACE